ncbi:MAG: hypothetical protein GX605_05950 [Chloroflexi bacterium]|nr:hypothetical protein [Chloroflexota bacterium]
MPTPRQRVVTALRRQEPDAVPFDFHGFTPAVLETFRRHTGHEDPWAYFQVPMRHVRIGPSRQAADFTPYYEPLPAGTVFDEWGVARVPADFYHLVGRRYPMRSITTVQQAAEYPYPDIDQPYRYQDAAQQVASFHAEGLAVRGEVDFAVFDTCWQLRGYQEFMVDLKVNLPLAEALMDHVEPLLVAQAGLWAQTGVDILLVGEDVGMQDRMIMRPDDWRRWIKPRLGRIIAAAKAARPDVIFAYHSDGYILPIIPDLIEIGVDVLNPVQPECMDPAEVKRQFGDRLAFWGTIGTQTTMPFGTPLDVREEVRLRIETVGQGGGLLIGPSHTLEPEVPWENIVAFVQAVREFGGY